MLKEVFLFARPEEKMAIERALISVVGPMYTVIAALGRGSKGGIEYGRIAGMPIMRLFARPALSSFLPKTAYYLVVDECDVDSLLTAVRGILASEGGPSDCGRGLAIVCPIDEKHAIHIELPEQAAADAATESVRSQAK